jgi:hypothetical protein
VSSRAALALAGSTCLLLLGPQLAAAEPQPAARHQPSPPSAQADAGAASAAEQAKLPPEHVPLLSQDLSPRTAIVTGDAVRLTIRADAVLGDDVTIAQQAFGPFEVTHKRARVEPAKDGRQNFVFDLELLAAEPGKHEIPAIELRVVTKAGFVGSVKTQPMPLTVGGLLANEPNAKLKAETKPVIVMQDDYRILYALGAVAAAALIALLTWLVSRYLQRRVKPLPPPPPPRPPWEIAVEKLANLRRRKPRMLEEGKAAQFVDEVSDVVREYLGGRFGFDGLESTTDEMLGLLRSHDANVGLWQEVAAYLARCDLVKFAKVEPDADEADLVFAKAQDIVQFSMPLGGGPAPAMPISASVPAEVPAAAPPPPSPARGPDDGEVGP